ncbi:MAG: hypothetical protein N0E48_12580 [Candidatus Thiodiazotropha endolucinida]|nr:hypothetical protein [Candidatus Thiodiazotropha taylori]MCW4344169.1 hypothetical protein [Candidatus Thiodiazotropha endolucinida]
MTRCWISLNPGVLKLNLYAERESVVPVVPDLFKVKSNILKCRPSILGVVTVCYVSQNPNRI